MLIGVIVCGIVENYSINLIQSIEQMSEKNDVKCVIIPVKFLGLDYEKILNNKYAYCYNSSAMFGLLSCFDGLIVEMASVLMYADDNLKRQYAEMFDGIPHVFISYDRDNVSSVAIDNQAGLTEALEYMYNNGARKYAMLGGTPNNVDAILRKACFEEFIKKHNLPYDEKSYQDGNFFLPCDREADKLVNDNMDADVFVCANDFLVRHIYKAVRKVGIRPGKDISVLGFDDSAICTTTYPSISSIRTDIVEVGKTSFELLMESIRNNKSRKVVVPSKFMLRDSILHREQNKKEVCDDYQFNDFIKPHIVNLNKMLLDNIRKILFEIAELIKCKESIPLSEFLSKIYMKLDDLFSCDGLEYLDWERLADIVNIIYKQWLNILSDVDDIKNVTDLYIKFHKYMMIANNYVSPEKIYEDITKNIGMELFFRETMQFVRNAEANYTRFIKSVEFLGIKNAFLYLYDEPIYYMQGERLNIPEYLNLKAYLHDGQSISVPHNQQKIKREDIFINKYVKWSDYSRLMLFPVYSDNILYGVLLCDIKRSGFEQADLFMNQMGAGIRMMNLRIENMNIVDNYEESMRKLKEYNITLDNMSKTDSLTGLNNRRGFDMRAKTFLGMFPNESVSVIIGYVDMNDLKLVNDRFGHDDGDFALKSIASVLTDYVTEYNGFGARIGGDEFAYIIVVPKGAELDNYRNELYEMFDKFNEKSIKAYNVEVSIGDCLMEKGMELTLEDALRQADERLYYEKSVHKKNSIVKIFN